MQNSICFSVVETSIHLLNITPQCRKDAETRHNLRGGLYLSDYLRQIHSYPNRPASHGQTSSKEDEVNNCTQLYSRTKTHTQAVACIYNKPINVLLYVPIYHYSQAFIPVNFQRQNAPPQVSLTSQKQRVMEGVTSSLTPYYKYVFPKNSD